MSEAVFKAGVVKDLRECNAEVLQIVASAYSTPGWPDTYVSHKYFRGFIEFKDEKTKLEPHQKRIIAQLTKHGNCAIVLRAPYHIENENGDLLHLCNRHERWVHDLRDFFEKVHLPKMS